MSIGNQWRCALWTIGLATGLMIAPTTSDAQERIIYFDTAAIVPLNSDELDAILAFVKASPTQVLVEGYTDERGESDYNLELGDRRARQVKADLVARGARSEHLIVVSRGERDPIQLGHDEAAWQYNRRVRVYPMPEVISLVNGEGDQ